ncbi:MAG: sigma-70 family RNA polymerase sigma factor [Planctomycetota bacterium]
MPEDVAAPKLSTVTSTVLLEGLRTAQNRTIWQQYVDRYRPVLVAHARRVGLSAADAEDVAQEALAAFCQAYRAGKYEREKGRLRDWLFGIARNQLSNWRRRQPRREMRIGGPGDESGVVGQLPGEDEWVCLWEQEWRDAVLRRCLEVVQTEVDPNTLTAFELFAAQGVPAKQVAERLGISPNAVFIAKHRVLRRIRELLPEMEQIW